LRFPAKGEAIMAHQNSENQRDLQQHIEKNRMGDNELMDKPGQSPARQDDSNDLKPVPMNDPQQVDNVDGRDRSDIDEPDPDVRGGTREPDDDPESETGDEDPGAGIDMPDDDDDDLSNEDALISPANNGR
jgi:hypothetical protein